MSKGVTMQVLDRPRICLRALASILLLSSFTTAQAVRYVWQGSSSPAQPYGTWDTAAHDIQSALLFAPGGETIYVRAGTYFVSSQINVSNDYAILSETGDPATTIIHGNGGVRCLNFEASGGKIAGFTITAGETTLNGGGIYAQYSTIITNCTIVSNSVAGHGGGVWMNGGWIKDCLIAENRANASAGAYMKEATMYECTVVDNVATSGAGGVYTWTPSGISLIDRCVISSNTSLNGGPGGVYADKKTTMWNCLVSDNHAGLRAGGVFASGSYSDKPKIDQCTIVDNTAGTEAGGLYANNGPWIRNTIVYYNEAPEGPNWGGDQAIWFNHAGSTPLPDTNGNVEGAPEFVDRTNGNYRLRPGSPCIDAGMSLTTSVDLDGSNRLVNSVRDLGCYEYQGDAFSVNVLADRMSAAPGESIQFTAIVDGANTNGLYYLWDVNDDLDWDIQGSNATSIEVTYDGFNSFPIGLLVSNAVGESDYISKLDYIHIGPDTLYVSSAGSHTPPYTNWSDAATNIEAALDEAVARSTIVLVNETFVVPQTLVVDKGVTITGVGGRDGSTISGEQMRRCVTLAHPDALLQNLTIKAGQSLEGGGVFISAGGTISNCVIRDCYATNYGGGVFGYAGGRVQDSLIASNGCYSQGAGAYLNLLTEFRGCTFYTNVAQGDGGGLHIRGQGARVTDCDFVTNWAYQGGAVYIDAGDTILSNCHVSANFADDNAGGIYLYAENCRIENCVIKGNYCDDEYGGGMYMGDDDCVIRGCSVVSNYSYRYGGGIYSESGPNLFEDCVVDGNVARYYPGGLYTYDSAVNRCEFKNNSAGDYGGGIYLDGGGMTNCLVVSNGADQGGGIYSYDGVVQNCTVVHNISTNEGGGIYDDSGIVRNCIVVFNEGPSDYSNYYGSANWTFSCSQPEPSGAANIADDPLFAARYRIRETSPCVDAGGLNDAPGEDYALNVRPLDGDGDGTNDYDMGYWEFEDLPIAQDLDMDGLTDLDEIYVYDFDPDDPDMDGDGLSDGDEVAAGTNPTDEDDVFELADFTEAPLTDGTMILLWSSVAGKQYTIRRGFDLDAAFTPIAQHIPAVPPINSWTDTITGADAWFYAIEVE